MAAKKAPVLEGLVERVSFSKEDGLVELVFADGETLKVDYDMEQNCCEHFEFEFDEGQVQAAVGKWFCGAELIDSDSNPDLEHYAADVVVKFTDGTAVTVHASNRHNGYHTHSLAVSSSYKYGPLCVRLNTGL